MMNKQTNINHEHNHDCDCEHHNHNHHEKPHFKMCVLEDGVVCTNCGACNICDLDPTKICDNCGKCLDTYNTNEKGYVSIPIDKIITDQDSTSLEDFYKMYGLDDDDDED